MILMLYDIPTCYMVHLLILNIMKQLNKFLVILIICYLADELEGPGQPSETPDVQTSVRRIERFLTANAAKGQHAVVVVDEATP